MFDCYLFALVAVPLLFCFVVLFCLIFVFSFTFFVFSSMIIPAQVTITSTQPSNGPAPSTSAPKEVRIIFSTFQGPEGDNLQMRLSGKDMGTRGFHEVSYSCFQKDLFWFALYDNLTKSTTYFHLSISDHPIQLQNHRLQRY